MTDTADLKAKARAVALSLKHSTWHTVREDSEIVTALVARVEELERENEACDSEVRDYVNTLAKACGTLTGKDVGPLSDDEKRAYAHHDLPERVATLRAALATAEAEARNLTGRAERCEEFVQWLCDTLESQKPLTIQAEMFRHGFEGEELEIACTVTEGEKIIGEEFANGPSASLDEVLFAIMDADTKAILARLALPTQEAK
jgi:hypothetical protein